MPIRVRRLTGLAVSLALPLAALAIVLFGLPAPARAANIVVHNCSPTGLRAAVLAANDGDLITFLCTIGNPTIVLTQTQVLSHDVTLDGGNAITITGGGTDRILSITAGHTATVTHLALSHGFAPEGSAINVFGAVVVDDVTFFDNLASSINVITGGAVSLHNASAIVNNSRFISNSAQSGAHFSWGGAIGGTGALTVSHSLFTANTADIGGAIFLNAQSGWIADSTFITNGAVIGGALTTYQNLTLLRDEFDLNHTAGVLLVLPGTHLPPGAGGALSVDTGAAVTIQRSLFFSNSANASSSGRGGAIATRGNLTLVDTLFNANHASGFGGAIANYASATLSFSSFEHNTAVLDGGAISTTGSLNVSQSTFFSNSATSPSAGGALANDGQALVQYSQFNQNDAGIGGGVSNKRSGAFDIESSTFESNTALVGGALSNNAILTLTNSSLVGNSAQNAAGALVSTGAGSVQVLLLNSTVTSNSTPLGVSALAQVNGTLTLSNTIAAGNLPANCSGTINNSGHNLQFGDATCGAGITLADPRLGPLQDNGGQRLGTLLVGLQTRVPLPTSPAINAADSAACPTRDERGFLRLAPCDIGAVERVFPIFLPLVQK